MSGHDPALVAKAAEAIDAEWMRAEHDPGCPGDERYCALHCPVPVYRVLGYDGLRDLAARAVLDAVAGDIEARGGERALREAADGWTQGEWANHLVTASDPAQIRIGSANRFGQWLRERADRLTGGAS